MNGVKSLAHSAAVRVLPRARSTAAVVRASTWTRTTTKGFPGRASATPARGISSTTSPLHLPERSSFQATYYQDHVPAFSVPDMVVDDLDPRNFGYRVVDLSAQMPSGGSGGAYSSSSSSYHDEDYDLYSLHVSPTQVTCTSYYVDVLGDDLPQLPVPGNATGRRHENGGGNSLQSYLGDAREDCGGIEDESSQQTLPVTDEDG